MSTKTGKSKTRTKRLVQARFAEESLRDRQNRHHARVGLWFDAVRLDRG